MELFVNMVIDEKPLTIFTKRSIFDWGSECASGISKVKCNPKVKFTCNAMVKGKVKVNKSKQKQILQERGGVMQKHVKNGLAK